MTREENILKERFGKENPFKVPDGYFDHLTEGGGSFWAWQHEGNSKMVAHAKQHEQKAVTSEEAAFNEMADYAMIDNETIYASLMTEN